MEASLLSTKLLIPPERPGLVPRPRLMTRMRGALSCSLTLISAPAGFGKTTVVSQWARQAKDACRIGWVSLDEADNDPVRFWDYFIAALRTVGVEVNESASAFLQFSQPNSVEPVLTRLVNHLNEVAVDVVIVLDDYHLVNSNDIHSGMVFLIEHMPPRMHIVIATRADPPLRLARYRGRGLLLEIGVDDLRFTFEEARALLERSQGSQVASEDVSILNSRAEGWAVGLTMAALSLGHGRDIKSFISSFTGSQRYVMDYLVEEVLKSQTEGVEAFLLKTSVLDRMTASLCDFLTERGDSNALLTELEGSFGGFLVALDESREWYRYHHLFADLLRHRSEDVFGEQGIKLLHRRASQWYEDRSLAEDAVRHALAAGDADSVVRIAGAVAHTLTERGEWAILLGWLSQIPDGLVRTDPGLYSQYACALVIFGKMESAEAAVQYLEDSNKGDDTLQGKAATLRAILEERQGNIPKLIEQADKALSLLPQDELLHRGWACYMSGFVQYSLGLLDEAWPRLTEAHKIAKQEGNHYIAAGSLNMMAGINRYRGKLQRALGMCLRALEIAGNTPAAAVPLNQLSAMEYELNNLDAAGERARVSLAWTDRAGNAEAHVGGHLCQAQALFALGNAAGAAQELENAWEVARGPHFSPIYKARHAVFRVLFAIRQDDLETATAWGRRLAEYSHVFPFEFAHVPSRLLIAQGKKLAAAEQLRDVYARALAVDAQGLIIAIRVCQALAAPTLEEAQAFLNEAVVRAEPEGYARTFVDEGKLLAPLLRKAMMQGTTRDYTKRLLDSIAAGGLPSPAPVRLLSERELEILRLVEAGLSNREIAEKLIITAGTVKAHVYNIMEKLEAHNRTQAVARAREKKLV